MSIYGVSGSMAPHGMTGASMRMPPTQKMASMFDKIDTSGSGSINKSQFTQAFHTMKPPAGFKSMGADAVWSALDPKNSGGVSKQSFVKTMTALIARFRSGQT